MDKRQSEYTITFLGCGTLGTAILSGVVSSVLKQKKSGVTSTDRDATEVLKFKACVTREESADRILKVIQELEEMEGVVGEKISIETIVNDNPRGVADADMVVLGCKPYMCEKVLLEAISPQGPFMLANKLLVSIAAGVSTTRLRRIVGSNCRVIRAMPNTASRISTSMTVISPSSNATKVDCERIRRLFETIGRTIEQPEGKMDAATALCGSGPAFFSLMLEAMVDGAVLMGVARPDAVLMAAQTMLGTASLVLAGAHTAVIREEVSTPAGCTTAGLLVLEDGKIRSTIARTVQETTNVAAKLAPKI